MTKTYIEQQIAEREEQLEQVEAQIAEAERRALVLRAEIRAYEDALNHQPIRRAASSGSRRKPARKRGLSQTWRELIAFIAIHAPAPVGLDDLYRASQAMGHDLRDDSVRSQMASCVKRGYVTRVAPGQFTATAVQIDESGVTQRDIAAAKRVVQNDEPPDAPTSDGSSNSSEGAAGLPRGSFSERPEVGSTPTASTSLRQGLLTDAAPLAGTFVTRKGR